MGRKKYFLEKIGLMKRPELFDITFGEEKDKQTNLFLQKFRWIPRWRLNNPKLRNKAFENILDETLRETDEVWKRREK